MAWVLWLMIICCTDIHKIKIKKIKMFDLKLRWSLCWSYNEDDDDDEHNGGDDDSIYLK